MKESTKNNLKEKIRSWALWVSLVSLVAFVWKEVTGVDISPALDEFMNYLLPVLVGFGIINNPNSRGSI